MQKTTVRPSTVPASPEVTIADVRGSDPDLVAEITTARRRLDAISPEVIRLLGEVRALEARVLEVADAIDGAPGDASYQTVERVRAATGAQELAAAAELSCTPTPWSSLTAQHACSERYGRALPAHEGRALLVARLRAYTLPRRHVAQLALLEALEALKSGSP
jgi:hypothetical protein